MPGPFAYLTAVFDPPSPDAATIHLDFAQTDSILGTPVDFTQSELEDLAQAAFDGWSGTPNLQDSFCTDLKLDHCEAYSYEIVTRTPTPNAPCEFTRSRQDGPFGSAGAPVAGTESGSSVSPQVATVVTFRTPLLSRRGRGRVYLPPIPVQAVASSGTINEIRRSTLQTQFNDWVIGIQNAATAGRNIAHVVFSCMSGAANLVTSRQVRGRVDTQRRRLGAESALI